MTKRFSLTVTHPDFTAKQVRLMIHWVLRQLDIPLSHLDGWTIRFVEHLRRQDPQDRLRYYNRSWRGWARKRDKRIVVKLKSGYPQKTTTWNFVGVFAHEAWHAKQYRTNDDPPEAPAKRAQGLAVELFEKDMERLLAKWGVPDDENCGYCLPGDGIFCVYKREERCFREQIIREEKTKRRRARCSSKARARTRSRRG